MTYIVSEGHILGEAIATEEEAIAVAKAHGATGDPERTGSRELRFDMVGGPEGHSIWVEFVRTGPTDRPRAQAPGGPPQESNQPPAQVRASDPTQEPAAIKWLRSR